MIERRERPTIMDGKVITFATGFEGEDDVFSNCKPVGPFEVSASRNGVMVHSAMLRTRSNYERFRAALNAAEQAHKDLAR